MKVAPVIALLLGTMAAASAHRISAQHTFSDPSLNVLHTFAGRPDGYQPDEGVSASKDGTLFGVTAWGGANNLGAVYSLTPSGSTYKETIIYSFQGGTDGVRPSGRLLLHKGSIFGTTQSGGSPRHPCGTVYKLSPQGSTYIESVIFRFDCGTGGGTPASGVIADSSGNLYGTTSLAGSDDQGIVFELTRDGTEYHEHVLHDFQLGDGSDVVAGLVFGPTGTLYGTAAGGGALGNGIVFEIAHIGASYKEQTIYTFHGAADGANPTASLTVDPSGALYGTTSNAGPGNGGTIFKLTPAGSGTFTYGVVHSFVRSIGPYTPQGGVLLDKAGNVFGTASDGGRFGFGAAYELSPSAGAYRFRTLYDFGNSDGRSPTGSLVAGPAGALFGTGSGLGAGSQTGGTVFELMP